MSGSFEADFKQQYNVSLRLVNGYYCLKLEHFINNNLAVKMLALHTVIVVLSTPYGSFSLGGVIHELGIMPEHCWVCLHPTPPPPKKRTQIFKYYYEKNLYGPV